MLQFWKFIYAVTIAFRDDQKNSKSATDHKAQISKLQDEIQVLTEKLQEELNKEPVTVDIEVHLQTTR